MTVQQNVKKLCLYHIEEDLRTFQAALRLIAPIVEELILSRVFFGDAGARVLAEILRDRNSFRKLDLGSCQIYNEGAAHLAGALRVNTSLQVFKLSWNPIWNAGVFSLTEALMNHPNIRVLHLIGCGMDESEGAAAVGRLLEENATIEELDLSFNEIDDAGCIALVDGLSRNQGLRVLNLKGCQVSNEGAKQIGLTLKSNSHLERLNLNYNNNITEEGLEALIDGLSCNTTLLEMNLELDDDDLNDDIPASLPTRIDVYLAANRLLHRHRSRETFPVSPFLLSLILARVSDHPAVLYLFVREHIPDLLASSAVSATKSAAKSGVFSRAKRCRFFRWLRYK
jgi:hypothetical protein